MEVALYYHTSKDSILQHNKINKYFFIKQTLTYNKYFIVLMLNARAKNRKILLISNLSPVKAIKIPFARHKGD